MREKFNEKLNYLNINQNKNILSYLKERLSNAYIEKLTDEKVCMMELFNTNKLMGWCWQSTETASLFLDDNDYIQRGYLDIDILQHNYYHSWICFNYNNQEYVYDPCFNVICEKEKYISEFKAKVIAQVKAKKIKEEFITTIINYKPKEKKDSILKTFMSKEDYEKYKKKHENEVVMQPTNNVYDPFYRSGVGYRATIDNNKIRKLTAHYYYTD